MTLFSLPCLITGLQPQVQYWKEVKIPSRGKFSVFLSPLSNISCWFFIDAFLSGYRNSLLFLAFWDCIMKRCILSSVFSVWLYGLFFFFYILFMFYYIDIWVNQPKIPGANLIQSWYIIFFICCWTHLLILLRIFASLWEIFVYNFLLWCFVWFWMSGYIGWGRMCFYFFLEEV